MRGDLKEESKAISDFLTSIYPWRHHVVIGGGYALIIYKLYFATDFEGNFPVGTRDIDVLIPRRLPEVSSKNIAKHLKNAGYSHFYKDYGNPATEAYTKEIDGNEIEIEFLTDDAARNKGKNIIIEGVVAQPLAYLKPSIENTLKFKTHLGKSGMVVSPEAWIFHKGLTFPKRVNESKRYKDLYGIWYAATQLQAFSETAIVNLRILAKKSPKWFNSFRKNLIVWEGEATPLDWMKLETQDPSGQLKRPSFQRLIKTLTVTEQRASRGTSEIQ